MRSLLTSKRRRKKKKEKEEEKERKGTRKTERHYKKIAY